MIKAVIFDCFGVIISDGLKLVAEELEKVRPDARAVINYYVRLANSGQIPASEYSKAVCEELGIPVSEWKEKIAAGEKRDDRVVDYIKSLRSNYKTAMLSNLPSKVSMNQRFSDEELESMFDVVVISGEEKVQKPDPEIYKITADRLGLKPEECVFLDDIDRHCAGAQEAGMKAIVFNSFGQAKQELEELLVSNLNN